ncbi:MAG: PAS domain S-box protein [Acidobacteria bacterium]|nr:PAS domain S-box protein [Acidobacteriota bacterium]
MKSLSPNATLILCRGGLFCSAAAVACAGIVLLGWVLGEPALTRFHIRSIPTAPSTACSFVLLGLAAWAGLRWPLSGFSRNLARTSAIPVAALSVVVLAQSILGFAPGAEERLFGVFQLNRAERTGYMSPVTAVGFLLLTAALLLPALSRAGETLSHDLPASASLTVISGGLTVLLGYGYGTPLFYSGDVIPVALPTAIAFVGLGLGTLAVAGPDTRLMRTLAGSSTHARLLRAFLPAILLVIVCQGWFEIVLFRTATGNPAVVTAATALLSAVLVVILVDWISARSGAALDRAETSLRDSEERFRVAFDQAAVGMVLTGLDGRFLRVNRAFREMLGYGQEELLGRHFLSVTFPEDAEISQDAVRRMLAGESERVLFEKRYLHKDGRPIWTSVMTAPARDAGGAPRHLITQVRDISAHRRAEEERARLEEQLRESQKLESVGRLAGGIAHDFNNLLTVINGYCDLLLARSDLATTVRERLEPVRRAGERAANLTRQMLAFSRKQIMQPKSLNLNDVVLETVEILSRVAGEDIALVSRLDPSLGEVRADPEQMHHVLMNLAVNARDAMPGGGTLTIETTNAEFEAGRVSEDPEAVPGRHVCLAVGDTGIGMDEQTRQRVFEPFFTTKEPGKGTGLGLSMVHGIVKQSGGWIRVLSRPEEGARFEIYLPRVDSPPAGDR